MTTRPRYPQKAHKTHRPDPAVVCVQTPPLVNVGANDTAAQVEYLRAKEKAQARVLVSR